MRKAILLSALLLSCMLCACSGASQGADSSGENSVQIENSSDNSQNASTSTSNETSTDVDDESSEEENAVFTELNLEYKVVTYNSKYMILHEDNESVDVSSIENDENDCVYNTRGWTNQLNLNQNYIWKYESNDWKYESVIFLIRQKADENTVQSRAFCYENVIDMVEISQQNI